MAITWRNINGPSLADASRPLALAGASMNSGFDSLMKVITDRQKVNQGIFDRGQDTSLLEAQELLAGAGSMDEVNALRSNLNATRAALDPTRRAKLLGAEDSRITQLDQQFAARQQATDLRQEVANRGATNDFLIDSFNRSPEVVAGAMPEALRSSPKGAEILKNAIANSRGTKDYAFIEQDRRWKEAAEAHNAELRPLTLQNARMAGETANLNFAKEYRDFTKGTPISAEAVLKVDTERKKLDEEMSLKDASLKNTKIHQKIFKDFEERFKGMDKDGFKRKELSSVLTDPKYKDVPSQAVLNMLGDVKSGDGWFDLQKSLKGKLNQYMTTDQYQLDVATNNKNILEATADATNRYRLIDAAARKGTVPGTSYEFQDPSIAKRFSRAAESNPTSPLATGRFNETIEASGQYHPSYGGPKNGLVANMLPITVYSESRGNPNAVGPKRKGENAEGLMQVMPSTGDNPGYGVKPFNPDVPNDRVRLGQDYLAAMLKEYGNDPEKAWAAYNWGPGNLNSAIKAKVSAWKEAVPKETREYVDTNMGLLNLRSGNGGTAPEASRTEAVASLTNPASVEPTPDGNRLQLQAQLESEEIQTKLRKDYSPEVKKFLTQEEDTSNARKRASIDNKKQFASDVLGNLATGFNNALTFTTGTLLDAASTPLKVGANAYNEVAGVANAYGSGLPRITMEELLSPTGYTDTMRRQVNGTSLTEELVKRKRAAFNAQSAQSKK